MMPTLRSEFKKLLSVRSTYLIALAAIALLGLFGIYVEGFKNSVDFMLGPDKGTLFIAGAIEHIATVTAIFGSFIALLLVAHEYRYDTIVYTLTASNSRTKVLIAKTLAVLGFTLVYSVLLTAIGIGMIYLGLSLAHHSLPHQNINYLVFFAKSVYFSEGYAMAGFLFAALIRNQIGAIAALLVLPNTFEGLLSLILKNNSVYMPFMALSQTISPPNLVDARKILANPLGTLSPEKGAWVFLIYVVIGWIVAWYLFLRRDAA